VIRSSIGLCLFVLLAGTAWGGTARQDQVFFLRLPLADAKALGAIEQIHVEVACSWISGLKHVPELYDIQMDYDAPTVNVLHAEPRLGGAAVGLSQWDGVIGVRVPSDADSRSCFDVKVMVGGRSGETRNWTGRQLGLPVR
jgi:hypothetical protein